MMVRTLRSLAILAVLAAAAGACLSAVAAPQAPGKCVYTSATNNWPNPTLVQFNTGKAAIHPDDAKKIADTAKIAKASSIQQICVRGFTDKQGGVAANQKLSLARAQAVAAELTRNGVDPKTIVIEARGEPGGSIGKGLGPSANSAMANQADRHVEIRFMK